MAEERPTLEELLIALGHDFNDRSLLERALTHSSFANESEESEDYERLEFLGDAVLELVVSDMLVERFPDHKEGELSRRRASAVNRRTLAAIARRLGLGEHVRMSHGEEKTGGREKDTILADVFEAVVGSIYLDAGLGAAAAFIERYFDLLFEGFDEKLLFKDYKTRLQEISQAKYGSAPYYRVVGASGPDHNKRFVVHVIIADQLFGEGEGRSKKDAEQAAAQAAFGHLAGEEN
ncbi:MAG: ribonuclease III [Candidatus Lernaella stagnicola]|nr:ribonuclease III [Candidatus Lernaella stagnicola]